MKSDINELSENEAISELVGIDILIGEELDFACFVEHLSPEWKKAALRLRRQMLRTLFCSDDF